MQDDTPARLSHPIRVGDRAGRHEVAFDIAPEAATRDALASELGLLKLRKLRFTGRLVPEGRHDWRLEASLGATVVQPCVVTLAPVTTRIDEDVIRRYVARLPEPGPGEHEVEDDSLEPLGGTIDAAAVMVEALVLALPPWPRAEGAPDVAAEASDDDGTRRPFAGLAPLRDRLEDGGEDDGGDGGH
ncbi:MAG: DUF177 domain-containing protein [Rhodobacteraceae bacterium]|nr:DUF177 domain-containing protein [Paracoccaceae bacterium]